MEKLKGKTILVGKEPGQGRLLVAVEGKAAAIGTAGCVPNCVSRCKPAENIAHAKIVVDQNGNLTLSNLKDQNVTYVNGAEIQSKRIDQSHTVELGKDKFSVSVPLILDTVKKIIESSVAVPGHGPVPRPNPEPNKFNMSHLEQVWNDMQTRRKEILAKQRQINLIRSGCGIFTMCAMPCIFFLGPYGYILTAIGIIGNIYSFVGLKNDDSSEAMEQLNEEFQLGYVCPNHDCNKFFGAISYKLLKNQLRSHKDQKMYCPRCGCELVEE